MEREDQRNQIRDISKTDEKIGEKMWIKTLGQLGIDFQPLGILIHHGEPLQNNMEPGSLLIRRRTGY